jgi:hypothetical protein
MKDFTLTHLCEASHKWIFGDRVSNGMSQEIKKAEKRGIPIRRFSFKCEEVS